MQNTSLTIGGSVSSVLDELLKGSSYNYALIESVSIREPGSLRFVIVAV